MGEARTSAMVTAFLSWAYGLLQAWPRSRTDTRIERQPGRLTAQRLLCLRAQRRTFSL